MERVLILGGAGRIGRSVAADLVAHTQAQITITGRTHGAEVAQHLGSKVCFQALDLADEASLTAAIATTDLVIHCAGPFHYRDAKVLQTCIQERVDYLDVSDHRSFVSKALAHRLAAESAGITAVINAGVFPGISNSMVRQAVEQLEQPERVHLSYIVSSSGGAGVTVMRTTFLGLQQPFEVWLDGQWQTVQPYSEPETVEFPAPYGRTPVYWFDMPEGFTLPQAFPVKTVITKFGSVPNFYSHLTWIAAHWFPKPLMRQPAAIEFLAHVSHRMTRITDHFSGIGVAIRLEVSGQQDGLPARICSTLVLPDTAIAAGYGAGSIAQLLLLGQLQKPGVWPAEEVLPTRLFAQSMEVRGVKIAQELLRQPQPV